MDVQKINDGAYGNFVTGMGTKQNDKTEHTVAKPYAGSDIAELASMKVNDGIAARIVESVPEKAFQQDISIIGDDDGSAFKAMSDAGLFEALQEAGEYQRMLGGAIIVTEYDGDVNADSLVSEPAKNARIKGYRVYSSGKVDLQPGDFNGDEPRLFRVELLDGKRIEIHPSRCTVIKGKKLPDVLSNVSAKERYFGLSALKSCENSLKNLANVIGSIVTMSTETGVTLFNLENFNEMLSKPDTGIQDATELMSLVKMSMSSMKAIFSGVNDKVQIVSHNFAGLPEILLKAMNLVCAESRIPMSILFGQSATGLAQTNEGDIEAYAELVESWRNRYLYRPTCKLINEFSSRNLSKELSEFEWGNLIVMSVKSKLEAKKMQAETLNIYYNMGAIDAESIRDAVFVNGHSWEVNIKE